MAAVYANTKRTQSGKLLPPRHGLLR